MAEQTIVGLVLSPIIEMLANKAYSYIESQYKWKRDMPKNFKRFADILTEIKTVVAIPEHLQSMGASQKQLLCQLKHAIDEADNLLDEFEYRIKEAQAAEDGGTASYISSSVKSAIRLIGPNKLANRLKEILDELDDVKHRFRDLSVGFGRNNAIQQSNSMHDRVTSSILPTSEIFGRTTDKEEIINSLLKKVDEPESSHKNIPVIAIVGDGGLGKTTLARLVYGDQRIKDQFNMMMWICVSENFDKIRLTKEILEYTSTPYDKYKSVTNFSLLQEELQKNIQSKQFLLVLDDVWIKEDKAGSNQVLFNQEIWEVLLAPLKKGKRGSKILVTTRMKIVASMFDAALFTLKPLSDNETLSILKKYAFSKEIPCNSSELEALGQLNIKRLNGSPLAARVVGSMLKDGLDARSWSEILESRIFNGIMPILELSYQRLPDHLKCCFAYCSIFPKDWKFEPKKLIFLWIAQGYVLPDGTGKSLIDIGMNYFEQLLSRSFLEKVGRYFDIHYVMHDLIHDLAQYVSRDECFKIDGGKQENIIETVRHLGIVINCVDELEDILTQLEKMSNLKSLRTLIFFDCTCSKWWHCCDLGILKELKSLRVLDIGESLELRFPEALCHCRYLRYLNLGAGRYEVLPKSLSKLYLLQVLSTRQFPLSQDMFRLLKFDELKLFAVQRLEFKVEREGCHRIGALKNMGMEIRVVQCNICIMNLENVTDKAEAVEADLESKQYLEGLELHWDSAAAARINGHDEDQEVAQALKPHPDLELLTIKGFLGKSCPSWLESKWLGNLRSLSLIDCSELEVLPPLDHLPLLKKCRVLKCPKLMSFPRFRPMLQQIHITETGLISNLSLTPSSSPGCFVLQASGISSLATLLHDHHLWAIQELTIGPIQLLGIESCKEPLPVKWLLRLTALKKLNISRCQEWLMSEEEGEDGGGILPSSLESLHISNCPITERWLSRCLQGLTFLKVLGLRDCPELKSLPQEDGGGVLPTSLESLYISVCPVTDLSWISHCTSLKKLEIWSCPELKSLPEVHGGVLLSSLEELRIWECSVTDLSLISHFTSLKKLIITDLKSLPEEGLPTSLEEVCFRGCGVPKESVVRCLQGLPSLYKLQVDFWTHLTALTSLRHLNVYKPCRCEPNSRVELPESLQSLEIHECDVSDTLLSTCLQGLTSLSVLWIRDCNELTSLPSAHVLHRLTTLQKLAIWHCKKLTSLGALHALSSLKSLNLLGCPEVKSLPKEGLPSSVAYLSLDYTSALAKQIGGPDRNKVAHIPRIEFH